eukprot:jgi/Botrbrau1/8714/Bobra.0311s0025.1
MCFSPARPSAPEGQAPRGGGLHLPHPESLALHLCSQLGLSSGPAIPEQLEALLGDPDDETLDLLLVHVSIGSTRPLPVDSEAYSEAASALLGWLDDLVKCINRSPKVRQGLLLVLLLGPAPGCQIRLPAPGGTVLAPLPRQGTLPDLDLGPVFPVVRPKQSWQYLGEDAVHVEQYNGVLRIERLPGVIRKDHVELVSVREARERGSAGCILADRLLPELAYKMGRASKYGS